MQTITLKMPKPLVDKLKAYAEQEERSKSFLIRKAIESYLREAEEDEADYREALHRLQHPEGKSITLSEHAKKYGLEIRSKRKGK